MSRYVFEVVLLPDEEEPTVYNVTVPDMDGCLTFGEGIIDALNMADDALKTHVAALLKHGDPIPEPTFGNAAPDGGMAVVLSFETDESYIVDTVTPAQAADLLGVSRGRVSQMIRDGILEARKDCMGSEVLLSSINARLAEPRGAGRPRKELTTA
jgi:excisionase family DNA binding protein